METNLSREMSGESGTSNEQKEAGVGSSHNYLDSYELDDETLGLDEDKKEPGVFQEKSKRKKYLEGQLLGLKSTWKKLSI